MFYHETLSNRKSYLGKIDSLIRKHVPQEKKFSREENLKYLAVFPEITKLNSRKI